MSTVVKRGEREIRSHGTISFAVNKDDVGKTLDFMGLPKGFRVLDVNVTVDEAFTNANNTIAVGIDGAPERFIAATAVNAVKGVGFNNRQYTAPKAATSILATIAGDASTTGDATITVTYAKLPDCRQQY